MEVCLHCLVFLCGLAVSNLLKAQMVTVCISSFNFRPFLGSARSMCLVLYWSLTGQRFIFLYSIKVLVSGILYETDEARISWRRHPLSRLSVGQ